MQIQNAVGRAKRLKEKHPNLPITNIAKIVGIAPITIYRTAWWFNKYRKPVKAGNKNPTYKQYVQSTQGTLPKPDYHLSPKRLQQLEVERMVRNLADMPADMPTVEEPTVEEPMVEKPSSLDRPLVNLQEASTYFGMSIDWVKLQMRVNGLTGYRIGNAWKFVPADIENWVRRRSTKVRPVRSNLKVHNLRANKRRGKQARV